MAIISNSWLFFRASEMKDCQLGDVHQYLANLSHYLSKALNAYENDYESSEKMNSSLGMWDIR